MPAKFMIIAVNMSLITSVSVHEIVVKPHSVCVRKQINYGSFSTRNAKKLKFNFIDYFNFNIVRF